MRLASIGSDYYNALQLKGVHTMVRISKQAEIRNRYPRRRRAPSPKTGPLKDNLPQGFKVHENSVQGDIAQSAFIPKIK